MSVDDQNTAKVSDNGGSGTRVSDKCPWCGSVETASSTEWTARFRCHSSQSRTSKRRQRSKLCGRYVAVRDGVRLRAALARIATLEASVADLSPPVGPTHAPPGYEAEIFEHDGHVMLGWQRDGEKPTAVTLYGLPCLFMGTLAQRDDYCQMFEDASARVGELEAELSRSRQGADDDVLPADGEWLTATFGGDQSVKLGDGFSIQFYSFMEPDLAFRGGYMDQEYGVRLNIGKTRGDVRRLVAALGGAEREDGK